MSKVTTKKAVAIYIRYNIEKGDDWFKKELFLRDYCKKQGYEVVEVFRDDDEFYEGFLDWEYYSKTMLHILDDRSRKYKRLIAIEVKEFSKINEMLHAFYEVVLDNGVTIETIKDGVLGEDMLFGVTIHENVMNKNDLEKAKSISFGDTDF
jgi:hypothetical protein